MLIDSCVVDIFHFFPLYNKNFLITKDNRFGFFGQKDNRGPPAPPPHFGKNYLCEGIDLETWNLACDTLVPSLVHEKIRDPPFPVISAKSRKNFVSNFSVIRSRDKVPMHKIKIVEKVQIRYTEKDFSPIGWRV